MDKKDYINLERVMKGVANHRRIQVLDTLEKSPELTVTDLAERLSIDFRTVSEHLKKLVAAGLVMKRHEGAAVCHALTTRGKLMLKFCRTLE
jgi:DNA-binding transcriptional ArsR family regulator